MKETMEPKTDTEASIEAAASQEQEQTPPAGTDDLRPQKGREPKRRLLSLTSYLVIILLAALVSCSPTISKKPVSWLEVINRSLYFVNSDGERLLLLQAVPPDKALSGAYVLYAHDVRFSRDMRFATVRLMVGRGEKVLVCRRNEGNLQLSSAILVPWCTEAHVSDDARFILLASGQDYYIPPESGLSHINRGLDLVPMSILNWHEDIKEALLDKKTWDLWYGFEEKRELTDRDFVVKKVDWKSDSCIVTVDIDGEKTEVLLPFPESAVSGREENGKTVR